MHTRTLCLAAALLAAAGVAVQGGDASKDGWITLFNGTDTSGWKLREQTVAVTKVFDSQGKLIPGARRGKVEQQDVALDAKNKAIAGARVVAKDGKKVVVDADGKPIAGARVGRAGGRDAVVDARGAEIKGARAVTERVPNTSGWTVEDGVLVCSRPHQGNDLLTQKLFTDFDLHIEYQATSNSGVYLQGRYEIQIINDVGQKPHKNSSGSIYGHIAPSKNMGKKPPEWNVYEVKFRAPRGKDGKVTEKARVTLVWNGEKVIDDAEIPGITGAALDGRVLEPGPLMLQGDHGKVSYRNIKIRPAPGK